MRWLLLDVGGVLADVDDATWPQEFVARWAGRTGWSVEEFTARVGAADLPDAMRRGDVEEDYWYRYGAAVGVDAATLAEMRADFWDAYCGRPDHDLLALAARLHGRVGLAILSNSGDGARREEERRFGFSRLFDPICYSHETGWLKPEPEAYLTALAAMDARAEDVLFVDNAPVCVEGAREVGIEAVLHEDTRATTAAIGAWVDRGTPENRSTKTRPPA